MVRVGEIAIVCSACGSELQHRVDASDPLAIHKYCTNRLCSQFGLRISPVVFPDTATDLKHDIAAVLKKHGKIDKNTVGKIAFDINQGGVRGAEWLNKKVE